MSSQEGILSSMRTNSRQTKRSSVQKLPISIGKITISTPYSAVSMTMKRKKNLLSKPIHAQIYRKRKADALVHGKDEVKKLPITVQEEGLMYNPINMHIEDHERLYQKDLRDKNKRKRFEVRYDVEADTRKDGMAQYEREQQMKINKISMKRYEETLNRGFDILTNDPIDNDDGPENAEAQSAAPDAKTSKT